MSVIQGDITDYSCVLEATRGVDVVIHTASLVDVWHKVPESYIYSVNVTGKSCREITGMEGKSTWASPFMEKLKKTFLFCKSENKTLMISYCNCFQPHTIIAKFKVIFSPHFSLENLTLNR